jgi:hypothetical protein
MPSKKKQLKTEPTVIKKPKATPQCPIHAVSMMFSPERGIWKCVIKGCKQAAFPPNVVEKGKPILGEGQIELVLVKDPDGNKRPRTLLRTVEQNIMIDITDYVTEVNIEREDSIPLAQAGSSVVVQPGVQYVDINIRLFHITDTR